MVCYAIVESQLRDGDVVWSGYWKTKLAVLQRLETLALKIIKTIDIWSCSGMTVENIICFDRNAMNYKIIHKLCPESFLEKYNPKSSFSSHHGRDSRNLQISNHGTENYKTACTTKPLKIGTIRLLIYVSCQQ